MFSHCCNSIKENYACETRMGAHEKCVSNVSILGIWLILNNL